MVDLKGQYQAIKEQINTSMSTVLETSAFVNGPEVHAFQKELEDYLGVKHVIPCANGTDALQVAMMGLGLKPGDEVITADFTFAATVEVIALLQLTPVLVDVDPDTFNIDIKAIERAITPKTKAIVPVHLFGQCANMDAIMALAEKHNLFVIEDNAQAIGATYTFENGKKQKAYSDARRSAAKKYSKAFEGQANIMVPTTGGGCDGICDTCNCHVFHQYTLKITNGKRDALVKHLNENGVPCGVYYPIPLHLQKAYADERYNEADFSVTNQLVKEVISLPMHTELDDEQINFIANTINDFVNR